MLTVEFGPVLILAKNVTIYTIRQCDVRITYSIEVYMETSEREVLVYTVLRTMYCGHLIGPRDCYEQIQ